MKLESNSALFTIKGRKSHRWLLHVAFWLTVLVFYTFFFGYQNMNYRITFSFIVILLPVTIVTTYFLNYELIPNYLFKKRYFRFFLYFIYTLIVSFYIEMMTVIVVFIAVAGFNLSELHPSNTNVLLLIAGMYVVVFLGVAVKLVNKYNSNQVEIQKLKSEKIEAELRFLKAQLHPHFLFNTLNNLYALTLDKSDQASEVVLKLSELLDFVLYECDAEHIEINREVKQIENYIELEKLRYGDRLDVRLRKTMHMTGIQVPPMLLMTLVENSFKHGVSGSIENSWIEIALEVDQTAVDFYIKNSKKGVASQAVDSPGGIGLENLQSRLKLIFGENHRFELIDLSESFGVHLHFNPTTAYEN